MFTYPRWMALAPNGDVFVADSRANSIVILRDKNKDGAAEERFTFADNLSQPFGMAFNSNWFMWRTPIRSFVSGIKLDRQKPKPRPKKLLI